MKTQQRSDIGTQIGPAVWFMRDSDVKREVDNLKRTFRQLERTVKGGKQRFERAMKRKLQQLERLGGLKVVVWATRFLHAIAQRRVSASGAPQGEGRVMILHSRLCPSFRCKPESKKRRGAHIATFPILDDRVGNDGIKTKGEWIPAYAGMTGKRLGHILYPHPTASFSARFWLIHLARLIQGDAVDLPGALLGDPLLLHVLAHFLDVPLMRRAVAAPALCVEAKDGALHPCSGAGCG